MSLLNIYRSNVVRKRDEIARLQQGKAKEQTKISNLSGKINSASQALSRANSTSMASMKSREVERYQKDQANAEKKVADFDNKIARKQKELFDEEKKVAKEEEREHKKQAREHASRMSQVSSTLVRHEGMHKSTMTALEKLQNLPERIVVLFLAANPADQPQLRLDEEARSITEMIRKAEHRDSVTFETRWAIRPMDVLQAINELNPTIIHFSGHGSDLDQIVFQDTNGNAKLVSKEAIVQTMMASSSDIRLVFFNTCYSRNQAEAVTSYVESAIGMNTSIGDEAAKIFASQFYSAIGFGLSVGKAFDQAKALIMMEGLNEENTPELFCQEGLDANELIIVRPDNSEKEAERS